MFNKLKALVLMALGVAAAAVVLAAPAAHASTPGCLAGTYAGFCATQQNPTDKLVFDVFHAMPQVNNKIIAYPNGGSDRATDFVMTRPSIVSGDPRNWKQFEYAPNGVLSGLCISDPGTFTNNNPLVLRPCNQSKWQLFTTNYLAGDETNGFIWVNWATNNRVTDNGLRNQLTGVIGNDSSLGVRWLFDATPNGGNA